eukprot:gene3838-biopygen3746
MIPCNPTSRKRPRAKALVFGTSLLAFGPVGIGAGAIVLPDWSADMYGALQRVLPAVLILPVGDTALVPL